MYLYSSYAGTEEIAMVVDGSPVGPLGRLFIVPQDEVVEVPEIAGNELIRHKGYLGVVKVELIKSKTELKFNLAKAREESAHLIEVADRRRFESYVEGVVKDRTSKGKPAGATPPAILDVMKRGNYKLEDYGIRPVGVREQEASNEVSALRAQVDELKKLLHDAISNTIRSEPKEKQ
jgi:hypothetical protein